MTISIQPLVDLLQPLKQQGLGPREAVRATLASPPTSAAIGAMAIGVPHEEIVQDSIAVAEAVREVFAPITAAELAIILHDTYPNLTALDIGKIILAPEVLPDTSAPEMAAALKQAGFSIDDSTDAVNVLYPITVIVHANKAWQTSGLVVTGRLAIEVTASGSWTANPATGMNGPAGTPYLRAKQGYTMPGQAEGALIGRIGSNVPFLVGAGTQLPKGQSGAFDLCINDDLNGLYGVGLSDNIGTVTVSIRTQTN